jgi:hypothetical protein
VIPAALAGVSAPARGAISGAAPIGWVLDEADVVVVGRVTWMGGGLLERIRFAVEIEEVWRGDGQPLPKAATLEVSTQVWPAALGLPYERGWPVALFLSRSQTQWRPRPPKLGECEPQEECFTVDVVDVEGLFLINNRFAVLPVSEGRSASSANDLRDVVFERVAGFLGMVEEGLTPEGLKPPAWTPSPNVPDRREAVANLLALLGELAYSENLALFTRYAESPDELIASAARAAILRTAPSASAVEALVRDIAVSLETDGCSGPHLRQGIPFPDLGYAARAGAFGMDPELVRRAAAYLPIYRLFADAGCRGMAIEALSDVGTFEDIPRLAAVLEDLRGSVRHDALQGLERLLGLDLDKKPMIPAYGPDASLPDAALLWEREAQNAVRAALAALAVPAPPPTPWEGCRLPDPVRRTLTGRYPHWEFQQLSPEWRDQSLGTPASSCVVGDFDRSCGPDYAMLLSFGEVAARQSVFTVFLSECNERYREVVLGGPGPYTEDPEVEPFLWLEPKGSRVREVLRDDRLSRWIELQGDALSLGFGDKAALTFLYRDGAFTEIVSGD